MSPRPAILVLLLVLPGLLRAASPAEGHFLDKVRPLLESRCLSCHGPDKVKGSLRMDSRAGLLKGGDSGPALVPGQPEQSLILQAVMHARKDLEMPPKEKLTPNDVAVLRRWIAEGAPWPETVGPAAPEAPPSSGERIGDAWRDPRNPIVRIFGGQRLDLWSVQPLRITQPGALEVRQSRPGPGSVALNGAKGGGARALAWSNNIRPNKASAVHPIDQFIRSKLAGPRLELSPPADARTLARRLYVDLTGLPPSPEEMQAFRQDRRPDAYERLVDQLLASPRYGEKQARAWLDVVRYSDSNGFDWDEFRPKAWRFRDYVIRSFNADKPFDQFIREQLAGDELVSGAPRTEAERDALIATGFLRLGPQDNSAALFNEQDRARSELLIDLTETTASAFLGLTMSCNRCHDHKFDPLSQADHYRLRAFFEPVKYADDRPLDLAAEQEVIRAGAREVEARLQPLQKRREELLGGVRRSLRAARVAQLPAEERALLELPEARRTNQFKEKLAALEKKLEIKEKAVLAALSESQKKENESLGRQMEEIKRSKPQFALGLLMSDNPEKVPVTRILFQGNHKDPRAPVEPGFISILDPNPATIVRPAHGKSTGRRLALANWIASTNNPLTARVLVNRLWQDHFGRGLVATPNDFGLAGARPTHPELLDWLAGEFQRGGWSVKKLHRLMVTSATYRQSSRNHDTPAGRRALAADAENTLLWRQNPRRLSAEQLRDALLAVAGTLKLDHLGGPPVWPELPPEILQANPAFLDDNEARTKGWYPSPKTNQAVRGVYLVQKRTVRVPFLETFDQPENSVSCARRTESIVAPQALSLLNSTLAVEAARALATRAGREGGEAVSRQIERAFTLAFQRQPEAEELAACLELARQRSVVEVCRALLNLNEFIHVD